jgi:CHAT domain-containing protein/tetratricopeptide (TPR) repeat protein
MKYNIPSFIISTILLVLSPFIELSSAKAEIMTNTNKASNDLNNEAKRLGNLGETQAQNGQYDDALQSFSKELRIRQTLTNPKQESITLGNIGFVYEKLGKREKALDFYLKSFSMLKSIQDQPLKAKLISSIAYSYLALGQFQKSLDYNYKALPIFRVLMDSERESITLNNIALAYNYLGKNQKSLSYYSQSLEISKSNSNLKGESSTLDNIGSVYHTLGEYRKALEFHFKALPISKSIGDHIGEATILNNIGTVYSDMGEYREALNYYFKILSFLKNLPDKKLEASNLSNIGRVYHDLGEWKNSLGFYEQALPMYKAIGDLDGEATALNNIGGLYNDLGEKQKALDFYTESLSIFRLIGNRKGEATALSNLGQAVATQKRPELGIFFLKQSINTNQSLRKDISDLPKSVKKTFANSSAHSYRKLATLLLEQGRVLEAQQVLDLLKVEEIDDYFRDKRGESRTQQEVVYLRPEQQLLEQYNQRMKSAIQIGQERKQLQTLSQAGQILTPIQQKRLSELDRLQSEVKGQFNQFIDSPEVQQLTAQLTRSGQEQISLNVFDKLRKNLSKLGSAALVYPLVLDDRIELIITTPDSPPLRRTIKIQRAQLNQAIIDYRDSLKFPSLDPKPSAQKLYRLLILPLEEDLKQANIKTIIYAPDGPLRYIPLAALYDGNQWIAERFAVNNITAASLSDLSVNQPSTLKVLAGAFANDKLSYKIQVGQQTSVFHGLPFAGKEVNALATTIPGTEKRIDQAFSLKTLKPSFPQYNILHFATHAAFFPGRPEDSFILFGDGERATLRSIEDWSLNEVDLVVLSACESGLGIESSPNNPKPDKSKLGSGAEILGLGYQFQQSGARATIASLWSVDDGGTQSLMSSFYKLLQKGNITKAEALRQAQVHLIAGKGDPKTGIKNLEHPHYWAPFFIIGNGL